MSKSRLAELNSKRVEAVQRHEIPDQVPFLFYEDGWIPCQRYGVSVEKYMKDPKTMLEVQVRDSRDIGIPCVTLDLGITMPAASFGAPIKYDDKHMPWIERPIVKEPKDLEKLQIPDPEDNEPMQRAIECFNYLRKNCPEDLKEVGFWIFGPFDNAALLRGVSEFMSDVIIKPDFARKLIELTTEADVRWLKKLDEVVGGVEVVKVGDDYAGYVSKKVWDELVFPYEKRVFDTIPNATRWFHTDGPRIQQPRVLESLVKMGVDVTHAFHPAVDLKDAKRRLEPLNVAIAWGIPPVDVLMRGPIERIDEWCKMCIKTAGPDGNYILAPSGGDCPGTPIEHFHAVMRAAEKYGKYPIQV